MPCRALLIACLCLSLSACLRASKPEAMDARCTRSLKAAQQRFAAHTKTADSANLALATELISAARIARQHQEFINCLDKSSRAISLLEAANR